MKVATIQYRPIFKDRLTNVQQLVTLVITAVRGGAKLIVMPELATTGYSFMNVADAEPYTEVLEEAGPNSSMSVFRALAHKYDVHLVWGLAEKDPSTGKLYNSQVLMCPNGEYETYRKVNRFSADFLWAAAGKGSPPVRRIEVDGKPYKVGLLVCRDIRDKRGKNGESFYEPGDADVVAFSANFGKGAFPATVWMTFTEANQVTLVVSNRYGDEVPNDFGHGGIAIVYPDGTVNCDGLVWDSPCIVYGEV